MLPRTGELLARKYRLGQELGRGAMGIVFEAWHETLDQPVAIKILRRSELEDEEAAVRRFEREARIVAKLDSAHVVKVIDIDRTDAGVPYLVMELLDGRDLDAEVEARSEAGIPLREVAGWMVQVCEAMSVAHDAGVVHRDLKLSNVFLTRGGTVKVLDFGVAVLRTSDPARSITTSVAGTPRYMAPEQLLGEAPNPSSDVWAIGVMLYRLLGGRFPFDAPTMAAQMLAMMEGCPPLHVLAPDLPKPLAEIVGRALCQRLEQRWPSVASLSAALAPFAAPNAEPEGGSPAVGASVKPPLGPARRAGAAREEAPASVVRGRVRRGFRLAALAVAAACLLVLATRTLRVRQTRVSDVAPHEAGSLVATPPLAPAPAALSSSQVAMPGGSGAEPPPARIAPLPRVAPSPANAPANARRARPERSGSPDDGFPPHL